MHTGRWSNPPEVRREVLTHAGLKRLRRVFDEHGARRRGNRRGGRGHNRFKPLLMEKQQVCRTMVWVRKEYTRKKEAVVVQ